MADLSHPAFENSTNRTVPGAVDKNTPPVSTKAPEPLDSHVSVFDAEAKRDAAIRLKMTQTGCTWPEAVKVIDGTPDAPDPLAARVATLESAMSSLSSRVTALEQTPAPAASDETVQ